LVRCGSCREVFNASWYLLDELPPEATELQDQDSAIPTGSDEPDDVLTDSDTEWRPPEDIDEVYDSPQVEDETLQPEVSLRDDETPYSSVAHEPHPETDVDSESESVGANDSSISDFDDSKPAPGYEQIGQGLDAAELQRRMSRILDVDNESNSDSDLEQSVVPEHSEVPDHFPVEEPGEEIVLDSISLPRTMQGDIESFSDFLESDGNAESKTNFQSSTKGDSHSSLEDALSAFEKVPQTSPRENSPSSLNTDEISDSRAKDVTETRFRSSIGRQQLTDIGDLDPPERSTQVDQSIKPQTGSDSGNPESPALEPKLRQEQKSVNRSSNKRDSNLSSTADDITLVEIPRLQPVRTAAWWLGSIFLVLLALFQLKQYYLVDLAQFSALRPYLATICNYAGCEIPPVREFALIELLDTRVNPHPDTPEALRVTASLINRATFEQRFPHIQVTLTDRVGRIVGRRTYSPKQYLGSSAKVLTPNVVERIALDLAHPEETAVGYELQLVSS